MPSVPRSPCTAPGCPNLGAGGRCPAHRAASAAAADALRGSASERGYNWRWSKESRRFLRLHPLCQCRDCDEGQKRVTLATVVDHIIPHKGDQNLFWDVSNWQSMSKFCHDRKTAREAGAFGHPSRGGAGLDGIGGGGGGVNPLESSAQD